MGKFAILGLAGVMLLMARCYNADLEASLGSLPIVGAMVSPPPAAPAYVASIGKPAANTFPESDLKSWFAADAKDPLAVDTWRAIASFAAIAGTKAGWAEACKKATEAAGAERASNPALGALACSADGTVTAIQRFAVGLLAMRAEVALYIRAVPGSSTSAIQARQGELRLLCSVDAVARQGGTGSALATACSQALETAYLTGDAPATFATLAAAYTSVAADIAARDPKTAPEPGYFEPVKK